MSESTEIARREETARELAGPTSSSTAELLTALMQIARDPTVDVEKFAKLAEVVRDTREDERKDREQQRKEEFSRAKAAACRAMPIIRKDGRIVIADKNDPNNRSKDRVQGHFERWPDVQRAITPHLIANHLTLTHRVEGEDGRIIVTAILRHDNGYEEESGRMPLPLDTSGGKNNVQGSGSAQSYGMRYSTRAILGLQFEPGHDDGNLIALPDEPLNDQQARRVAEAETLFAADPQQFEDWWKRLQPQDKAWMIQTGRYATITGQEAGRLIAHAPVQETGAPSAKRQAPAGHDVSTPEGWTAKYEEDCAKAASLDQLQGVQRKGAGAMGKLKENGMTDLHDRAIRAGSDAYSRLSGTDGGDA